MFLQKETAAAHLEECVKLPQPKPLQDYKLAIEGPAPTGGAAGGTEESKALVPKTADESGEWQVRFDHRRVFTYRH